MPVYWAGLTCIYGRSGRVAEAHDAMRELLQAARRSPVQSGVIAAAYLGLGDKDSALTWLERAYAEHSNDLTTLKVNPAYDALRGESRYQRLLERVGLAR